MDDRVFSLTKEWDRIAAGGGDEAGSLRLVGISQVDSVFWVHRIALLCHRSFVDVAIERLSSTRGEGEEL
ncbi:hypothetical protein [Geobacillus sp. YF-1]|uniref:hypothetical protein n=1 Tax=Geobacillus sp. YF-1 TaxID=3457480 RepID=UPI004045AA2F